MNDIENCKDEEPDTQTLLNTFEEEDMGDDLRQQLTSRLWHTLWDQIIINLYSQTQETWYE